MNSVAGRAQNELDNYDLISKYDTHATTIGKKQGNTLKNHLKELRDQKVDDFTKTYKQMLKSTNSKAQANKLQAQIDKLKRAPEINVKSSNININ